ncbi:hypothetical protein VCR5J5_240270 [Vibrio crassostreae]|uniref:Uncharacterized protein n=1 Tax=Vibrio crassostreae TaxID=246167 RepID=A0A822MU91_9VIBR|nr:hypothetical protein VCR5J5_240270 [Vibrio crassostreae]
MAIGQQSDYQSPNDVTLTDDTFLCLFNQLVYCLLRMVHSLPIQFSGA